MNRKAQGPIFLTKEAVAKSQLETAIKLWFHYGDPASIHTLAVAAHDCLHELAKAQGKATAMKERMDGLSRRDYDRITAAQIFFKHGNANRKKILRYDPKHAEVLMFDSAIAVEELFGPTISPIVRLFWAFFAMSNPEPSIDMDSLFPKELREYLGFKDGRHLDRPEFFERFQDFFR